MNRIVLLGMDLSGKSLITKKVSKALDVGCRNNLLAENKEFYQTMVKK